MRWKIAEAKQRLSQVIHAAATEPQLIFNRDRLVAAVIDPAEFEAFRSWKQQQATSLLDAFSALRSICAEECYALEAPRREDRTNPFAGSNADAAR